MEKQTEWRLVGYCPGCKEPIYYNWHENLGDSGCLCERHTTWRQILKQREEEDSEG